MLTTIESKIFNDIKLPSKLLFLLSLSQFLLRFDKTVSLVIRPRGSLYLSLLTGPSSHPVLGKNPVHSKLYDESVDAIKRSRQHCFMILTYRILLSVNNGVSTPSIFRLYFNSSTRKTTEIPPCEETEKIEDPKRVFGVVRN